MPGLGDGRGDQGSPLYNAFIKPAICRVCPLHGEIAALQPRSHERESVAPRLGLGLGSADEADADEADADEADEADADEADEAATWGMGGC